jgi:predicted outer membrane repeat protein
MRPSRQTAAKLLVFDHGSEVQQLPLLPITENSEGAAVRYEPTISTLTAALLATFGTTIPFAAQAAVIAVTDTGDSGSAGTCTLRQAIASMNAGAVAGTGCTNSGGIFGSGDTIAFSTAAFPSGSANTITLASGQLSITAANLAIEAVPNGNVTVDAHQASRVMLDSAAGGSLSLDHLSLINGTATTADCFGNNGGGICSPSASLTLTHSTLNGNSADWGGGIFGFVTVTLTNSTLSGNSAVNLGGGIYCQYVTLTNSTLSGNSAASGGGILTRGGNITGSTLSSNSASQTGGGIDNVQGDLTLTNSTLSGNSAHSATLGGGGIYLLSSSSLTLTNATISANYAPSYGGGVYALGPVTITANNSIVAGNTTTAAIGQDVRPGIDYGLDDLIGVDPKLGPLANNGGPTQTMLPLPGSPAIDNGSDATCAASPVNGVDQRGIPRPQGARCDIGAVETDTIFADGFE